MNKLLHERKDFVDLANALSAKEDIPIAFIIKDYWVTESLRALALSKLNPYFLFKGGTSLSKALGIIKRFSEDIDLLFVDETAGKKKRKNLMKSAETIVGKIPQLDYDRDNPNNFSSSDHRTSCFKYPAEKATGILPYIRMEMGFRGGNEPSAEYEIQSIIGKALSTQSEQLKSTISNLEPFKIQVLDPFRTMIEKVFSLHRAYFENNLSQKERHFYDVYCLLKMTDINRRLATKEHKQIKENVAHFDAIFGNKHIPDNLNFSNSPIFSKSHDQYGATKRAYENSDIYFGERPSFDEMIEFISGFSKKM